VVAGEASGDSHAAALMKQATDMDPSLSFTGIGGAGMRAAGLDAIFEAESIAVVGFLEVVRHLPRLRRALAACVRVLEEGIDAVLLVDYPGFNLRLAARAQEMGTPVICYISPQVWAWKPGRINRIVRVVNRMLVVFPFEVDLYRKKGMDVEYVGHPLVETARPAAALPGAATELGLDPDRPILGILPGSRLGEIQRNLPPALGAARLLKRCSRGLQLVLSVAGSMRDEPLRNLLSGWADLDVRPTRVPLNTVLPACRAAIVSSGTATLETALLEVPMVVIYRLNPVTAAVARRLTVTDTFGLVNIVAGKRIVPECIQEGCTPEAIAKEAERFLTDDRLHARTVEDLRKIRARLGSGGASRNAAASLIRFLDAAGAGDPLTRSDGVSGFQEAPPEAR
jgi:lipid-A-disaccharide synthase